MKMWAVSITIALVVAGNTPAYSRMEGFVYNDGVYTSLTVPGADDTYATGINNAGQVVGYFETYRGAEGFLYSGGVYTILSEFDSSTLAINNLGQVLGESAIYENGIYTPLNLRVLGDFVIPTGINDNQQIVGTTLSVFPSAGVIYSNMTYTILNEENAQSINDIGQVVGMGRGEGFGGTGYLYSNSTYSSLDFLPYGINDYSQIVGWNLQGQGVIYSDGSDTTFTIIPNTYTLAYGINDQGEVVGAYLVPEPPTWAMALIGFAGLGYAGWRTQRKTAALAS